MEVELSGEWCRRQGKRTWITTGKQKGSGPWPSAGRNERNLIMNFHSFSEILEVSSLFSRSEFREIKTFIEDIFSWMAVSSIWPTIAATLNLRQWNHNRIEWTHSNWLYHMSRAKRSNHEAITTRIALESFAGQSLNRLSWVFIMNEKGSNNKLFGYKQLHIKNIATSISTTNYYTTLKSINFSVLFNNLAWFKWERIAMKLNIWVAVAIIPHPVS